MRRRLSATRALTCVMAPDMAAGGLVGPLQQLDLGRLGDRLRQHRDVVGPAARRRGSRSTMRSPSATTAGGGGGRLGRGAQALLGEVGGVGVAGGLAGDDPDAGAAVAAGGQLLDPARRRAGPTSPACPRRTPRRSRRRCGGPRRGSAGSRPLRARWTSDLEAGRGSPASYRDAPQARPRRHGEAHRRPTPTRPSPSIRVRCPCWPRPGWWRWPRRPPSPPSTACSTRRDHRRHAGAARPPLAVVDRLPRRRRGHPRAGRGPAPHLHGVGRRRAGPRSPPARSPG